MLKKITEPQAIYQKSGSPAKTVVTEPTNTPVRKKPNWKIIGSILIVSIVAIAGIAGVLIAQRQRLVEGPVTPNAPESQPSADTGMDKCAVSFVVTPPATPIAGTAKCVSKTAAKVGTGAERTALAANSKVKRGDKIEYTVTFSTQSLIVNDKVTITDVLPSHLQYVGGQAKLDGVTTPVTVTGNTISLPINLGAGSLNKQMKFTYQAQVKNDAPTTAPASTFTNAVKVVTNSQTTPSTCQIALAVEPVVIPPSGVAKCVAKTASNPVSKTAYTTTGSSVSKVKRGDKIEYKLSVSAEKTTKGAVVVTDTLPAHLRYDAGSAKGVSTQPTVATNTTNGTTTLTFNLGTMATAGTKQTVNITYTASVKTDAAITNFSNTARVVTAADATTASSCTATLGMTPVGVAQCTGKSSISATGSPIANEAIVKKGDVITYRIKVTAAETTSGPVVVRDTLPASVTYDSAITPGVTHSGGVVTANLGVIGDTAQNREITIDFKVKVNDNAPAGDFVNTATVTTAGANSNSCPTTLRLAYACNIGCTTDDQCKSIGNDYICSGENGNTCRLASNPGSSSCQGTTPSYSCNSSCENDSQCQQSNSNYKCADTSEGKRCRHKDYETQSSCEAPSTSTPTPTPTIGCNAICVSNADCTNPAHICYTTSEGDQRCRLDEYPTATNCVEPGTPVATTQPELPQELPQTGPEDWVNWLKAGLVTLGIGAVLLLLL